MVVDVQIGESVQGGKGNDHLDSACGITRRLEGQKTRNVLRDDGPIGNRISINL